jgi:NADH-quinone oxidoreductase subunit J
MTADQIIFYVLAAFILITAILSVTTRKIFRSAIWLLFSLIGIAGFYFWIEVEFIAAVQIIVYVGGIVVLIIFSIFLTQQAGNEMAKPNKWQAIFSALAVVCGMIFTINLLNHYQFIPSNQKADMSVHRIGEYMLNLEVNGFALPFELVSILLLAAMVGCIVIALKIKPNKI